MKKIIFVLLASVCLLSCEKPHSYFIIKNSSGTKLWVQYYYTLSSNYPYTIPVYPGESREVFSSEGINSGGTPSWLGNYKISINHIINDDGDTINFDPNSEGNWVLNSTSTRHNYLLTIDDQSF